MERGRVMWVPIDLVMYGTGGDQVASRLREATTAELVGEIARQGQLLLERKDTDVDVSLDRVRRALHLAPSATPEEIADEAERAAREHLDQGRPVDDPEGEISPDPDVPVDDESFDQGKRNDREWDDYLDNLAEDQHQELVAAQQIENKR